MIKDILFCLKQKQYAISAIKPMVINRDENDEIPVVRRL